MSMMHFFRKITQIRGKTDQTRMSNLKCVVLILIITFDNIEKLQVLQIKKKTNKHKSMNVKYDG